MQVPGPPVTPARRRGLGRGARRGTRRVPRRPRRLFVSEWSPGNDPAAAGQRVHRTRSPSTSAWCSPRTPKWRTPRPSRCRALDEPRPDGAAAELSGRT